mgnify:CR=1 FL=1
MLVNKMRIIQNLIAEEDLLIPEEVLDYFAGKYVKVKHETKLTFEEYVRIQFLDSKIKIIEKMR